MKNCTDLGGCCPSRPLASVDNILRDLHNSSHPAQPHAIIAKCFPSTILHKQCFQFSGVLQSSQEKSASKLMHNFRGKTRLALQVLQTPQKAKNVRF